MDSYQAIYDAVRSRISGGDVGAAIEAAMRNANIDHYASMASEAIKQAASFYEDPSVLYRPRLSIDGDQWCALYGDNLQDGVAGFGSSPAEAMQDFNRNWHKKLARKQGDSND